MKTNTFLPLVLFLLLFTISSAQDASLSYCQCKGDNVEFEYIERFQIAGIDNTSTANDSGYSDFTSISTELAREKSYEFTITAWQLNRYYEGYSIWIDYNQDGDFTDGGEKVFQKMSDPTNPVSGVITIPSYAHTGKTRMRIAIKHPSATAAGGSCEIFKNGEVEDYTIFIKEPVSYCNAKGDIVEFEYIQKFELGDINNYSTIAPDSGYSDYTSRSTDLLIGETHEFTITAWQKNRYHEGYSVWIDYNQDGDFTDGGEKVFQKMSDPSNPVSGTFTIPSYAYIGKTRLRVAIKHPSATASGGSCENFKYGEVEDYVVNLIRPNNLNKKTFISKRNTNNFSTFTVYPNPVKSELNINTQGQNINNITVFSAIGKTENQLSKNNSSNTLDVSRLNNGVYFIKIETDKKTEVKKFVKK